MITATDFFCGAGGSSTGLVKAGMSVKLAANHWRLAIETHATNHPTTEHDCADLQQAHPSAYPRTTVAWFSPECTNHSLAKGRKRKSLQQLDLWGDSQVDPAEERSRATMREVVEFTEYHRYDVVIVENVVDIRYWAHYDAWIDAMTGLGYEYKALYLNAQFFGVPQSRDRVYVVFWRRGMKRPDLDFRPRAHCPTCGDVRAYQSFKRTPEWGRYGSNRQYIYRCEKCRQPVRPLHTPAATAIDWGLPVTRIADRAKPLQPKTMRRIEAGLEKLGLVGGVPTEPLYLNMKGPNIATPVTQALGTITTKDSHTLIMPAWLLTLRQSAQYRPASDPLTTITAGGNNHALVYAGTTAQDVGAAAMECGFRMLEPHEIQAGMGFPVDYVVLGGKRDKVKQLGNAVCCPIAQMIGERVVAALSAAG